MLNRKNGWRPVVKTIPTDVHMVRVYQFIPNHSFDLRYGGACRFYLPELDALLTAPIEGSIKVRDYVDPKSRVLLGVERNSIHIYTLASVLKLDRQELESLKPKDLNGRRCRLRVWYTNVGRKRKMNLWLEPYEPIPCNCHVGRVYPISYLYQQTMEGVPK